MIWLDIRSICYLLILFIKDLMNRLFNEIPMFIQFIFESKLYVITNCCVCGCFYSSILLQLTTLLNL